MIVVDPPKAPGVRLLGTVRGFLPDAEAARKAADGYRPEAVGLAVSPSELEALATHFVDSDADPVVPLSSIEVGEARGLARFGEVAVPNPAIVELLRWGRGAAVPVEGLDPDEDVQAELFVAHIGYLDLVRRTVRERRAARQPPEAPDADAFSLAWDREIHPGRGSERYARARDRTYLDGLRSLRERHRRVLAVVDRERVPRIERMIAAGADAPDG